MGDALKLVAPWRTVLDAASWSGLVRRHVLPKIEHALSSSVVVDPSDQDVRPITGVLVWSSVLSNEQLAAALVGHFFPKWMAALRQWL